MCCTPLRDIAGKKIEKNKNLTIEAPNDAMWANVKVLASVDESSYDPDSPKKMGDHPVVWTNEKMAARNIYIFMGHSPDLLKNKVYTTLLQNAILWAARQ